ncbi:signal transduction histidine kinase [Burkholderia sp. Ch1-1]|uniref:histidine kinase n=1 Tax=Paraburkholderia dioscoreae TaxID=2604047 RepID=A0A5Q4ZBP0_9BURK|nr:MULTISPECIES: ATP-binding protein [Paraburkholderia]EIF33511.1 signal transduction histidine kinase [Burkholderia sp. Ch1-1]MDR8395718.1 ATP-binding protein [Paraburkholderia sp. USG1]VVD32369.1 osmolarity sensor protein EnvZ [Paraburkholderia dioscoreae]
MTRSLLQRALPRTLLARNIALLIALVMLSQMCVLGVLLHYVQRPRVERAAAVFATYVSTLDNLLAATPPKARSELTARLDARAQVPAEAFEAPPRTFMRGYRLYQRSMFLDSLRAHLPADMPALWQTVDGQRLWIRMHAPADAPNAPYWIALPVPEDAQGSGLDAAILLSLGLGALAALTGYLIQRHLNQPLQELTRAARRVSAGEMPAPLPTDGPTEIAAVSGAFNQMTQALQQAEASRALMLAGISHDIRTPLTKLRLSMAMAMPNGSDSSFVVAAESYLDQIETILQQFMDYAGSGEREQREPGDLNALIERLAGDFAGLGHGFELSLANLPAVSYRPISMMRLLMNLMQNAIVYGGTGLAVRSWATADSVIVAVGDRGKGLSAQELEQLKAPFQRGRNARSHSGGTGLGLAIVERIARLHGGSLQFHAREGGGLEVWVVLPLSGSMR